ncbi:MAG: NBR1-Ig-like domain-containing protein [Actinomycetota bacterium]|nr:NBR1-Ig-like domain-containing protein [Actinomycetota bacterium]
MAVRNQGGAVWPGRDRSGPNIRLFARWLRAADNEPTGVTVHAARTRGDLPPGAEMCVQTPIMAPSEPGRYLLELQMQHQGVARFGDVLTVPVEVGG